MRVIILLLSSLPFCVNIGVKTLVYSFYEGVSPMKIVKADVLIIGSGIAGLYAANLLAKHKKVILITKSNVFNSNSYLAQGGIAATIDVNDHWQEHLQDTYKAGNYHHIESPTEWMIRSAPEFIQDLIRIGVPFDRNEEGMISLGREGGHLQRRIVHAGGDATGKKVIETLYHSVVSEIQIEEHVTAYDLVVSDGRCIGVVAKNIHKESIFYQTQHTIMATGGLGGLYPVSSNASSITGDGLAMAYRAGVELADLEFLQFHPTVLFHSGQSFGLISEAVRGEGAKLVTQDGDSIMAGIHPLQDLAPRDIVARRIYEVMNQGKQVFLDISMIKDFSTRFPSITQNCINSGLDQDTSLLPISPAAHFHMGGIRTNEKGETSLAGLYAIGEVAFTGVHGANRLASNSLLEGLFFAKQASDAILAKTTSDSNSGESVPVWLKLDKGKGQIKPPVYLPSIEEIQNRMHNHVGIMRNHFGLSQAKAWFEQYFPFIHHAEPFSLNTEQLTTLNRLTVGWLLISSALQRTESRGAHYRTDYPAPHDEHWKKRYLIQRREEKNEYDQIEETSATTIY